MTIEQLVSMFKWKSHTAPRCRSGIGDPSTSLSETVRIIPAPVVDHATAVGLKECEILDRRELAAGSLPAMAEDYEVQMLGLGSDGKFMVFDPAFLKVEPGDTVTFVPTTRTDNSEPIPGMLPEGAEPWKGNIHEEITVTFDVEGVYGYMCDPHYRLMGMVGLIQVGEDLSNLNEAQAVEHPHMAGRRMSELFE